MALTQTQVSQLYVAIFNRASEGEGNKFWQTSQTAAAAANDMLATTDAKAYFGANIDSNQDFIVHIYSNTLNKTYAQDKTGIDYWVNALNSGVSRGEVVASLVAAVADYSSSTDPVTKAAYDQFNNRVDVSNYMADTVEKAPANYATSTKFAINGTTGLVVTNSASTVTAAKTSVDTMKPVPGQTFTLTTGADTVVGTTGDDTITGAAGTLNANDNITDASTTDKDVLNATVKAAPGTVTIKNIETVNLDWDAFGTATYDLLNVSGATVNLTSSNLGYNGNVTVTNANKNGVVADSKATGTFNVTGIADSVLNSGSSKNVTLVGTATVDKAALTVNNDITTYTQTAGGTTLEYLTLSASKDVTVNVNAGDKLAATKTTVAGDKSITIKTNAATGQEIVNELTAGKLTVVDSSAGAALDVSKIQADLIEVAGAVGANPITVANGANLYISKDTGAATTIVSAAAKASVDVKLDTNQTLLNVTGVTTANFEIAKNINAGIVVTDLDNKVTYKGAGNLVLTNTGSTGKTDINASAMTGTMDFTGIDLDTELVTSSAGGTITLVNVNTTAAITGGAGKDIIKSSVFGAGTIVSQLGAGDDTFEFTGIGAGATGKVVVDGGTGTDTFKLGAALNISTADLTLTNVENIVAVTGSTFDSKQLSGGTFKMATTAADGNLIVTTADNTGATVDLTKLTWETDLNKNFKTVSITGGTGKDTISGTSKNDTIDGGLGADNINISQGGADIIHTILLGSTEAAMDKVTGFSANTVANGGDKLTFAVAAVVGGDEAAFDVSNAIVNKSATDVVTATATNGFITIGGANSDKIDTLAEWIDVAQAVMAKTFVAQEAYAFKFSGNTYVVQDGLLTGAADDIVIELTGLTSATSLTTAATGAVDAILIG